MRLLVLTADYPPIEGGIATLTAGISRALARRGHAVTVLAPSRPGARRPEDEDGVRIERWHGYGLGPARLLPFAVQALPRRRRFDALLAMNPAYGGAIAAVAARLGGPPYLAWAYGMELLKARRYRPLGAAYRRIFAGARAAIAISRFTATLLAELGVAAERIALVPPGVDPAPGTSGTPIDLEAIRRRLDLPQRFVLTVSRLVARKGHLALLEAIREVVRRHPGVGWVVAGRGPIGPALRARATELGLDRSVQILGYVPPADLEALYRLATVFALTPEETPGDAEGFGLVFLEAGARGLPVVAGRSGGVPDAVRDGATGYLVDPASPAAIAAAILALVERPDDARRIGEAGRAHALAHSWDRAAATVETLLAGGSRR